MLNQVMNHIMDKHTDKNCAFNIRSMCRVLSMLLAGISDVELRQKLEKFIASLGDESQGPLNMPGAIEATNLFYDPCITLHRKFQDALASQFKPAIALPLEDSTKAARIISSLIETQTCGRVKNAIEPKDVSRHMVLIDAFQFSGPWRHPLKEASGLFSTREEEFATPFLSLEAQQLRYVETESWRIVELPYSISKDSMIVAMPIWHSQSNYFDMSILDAMNSSVKTMITFSMPKFKVSCKYDLIDVLMKCGLEDLFAKGAVSGMLHPDTSEDMKSLIQIDRVLQKNIVGVDAKGTKAETVTVVGISGFSGTLPLSCNPLVINVDRPFCFAIVRNGKNGLEPILVGNVNDPRL